MEGPQDPKYDFGTPARLIFEDIDNPTPRIASEGIGAVWTISEEEVRGRTYRVKMLAVRGTSNVQDLWIVRTDGKTPEQLLHLTGAGAVQFVALMRNNAFEPADGSPLPAAAPRVLPDAASLSAAYEHNPTVLRLLIEADTSASDVVAIAHRRHVVGEFRRMMHDATHFDSLVENQTRKSAEGVWQDFFEANPWLLGLGMDVQLLLGWDEDKLEQVVVGADLGGPGKRADAVLRTAGLIGLLALGEIKHHRTSLLTKDTYRSGCWPPSKELAGAVAQSQGTVQLTLENLKNKVELKDENGFNLPLETTHLYRPRSFVIIGCLSEFLDPDTAGRNEDMVRSFELFRRNLNEPQILTFDELLARAEAVTAISEGERLPDQEHKS